MTEHERLENCLRTEDAGERDVSIDRLTARMALEATSTQGHGARPSRPPVRSPMLAQFGGIAAVGLVVVLLTGLFLIGPEVGRRLTTPPSAEPAPAADLLDAVRAAGVLRIAVHNGHPQIQSPVGGLTGFDVDVAEALGDALGMRTEIVVVDAADGLIASADDWDVALPSQPAGDLETSTYASSAPYYHWPRYLLVDDDSTAATVADLAGGSVCAVAGDAGEDWLAEGAGAGVDVEVVAMASEEDCLAAIAEGAIAAMVTATLSTADLDIRPSLMVIGGAPTEARVIVAPREAGPARLLAEIDQALDRLRADGTMTRLSQSRFGGQDLSSPPAS